MFLIKYGHYAIYQTEECDCLEYRLSVEGDTEISVRIKTKSENIFQAKDEPFVESILRSIQKD